MDLWMRSILKDSNDESVRSQSVSGGKERLAYLYRNDMHIKKMLISVALVIERLCGK